MAATLSVAMVAKNNAGHLRETLHTIREFADEICIVDLGSQDETLAISREFGATVSVFLWCDDWAAIRNEALRLCTKQWVFMFDPREYIDVESFRNIRSRLNSRPDSAYRFSIHYYTNQTTAPDAQPCAANDPMSRGYVAWYPDNQIRLYPNNGQARYEGEIDEDISTSLERIKVRIIDCNIPIHHYTYVDTADSFPLSSRVQNGNNASQPESTSVQPEASSRVDSESAIELKSLADQLHAAGQHEKAMLTLQQSLQMDPSQEEAWRNLCMLHLDQQSWKAALECIERAVQINPEWKEAARYRSMAYEGMGRLMEAAQFSETALRSAPNSQGDMRLFIHQMLRLERRSDARRVIEEIISQGVENANLHNALGELYYYDKCMDESITHFEKAGSMGLAAAYNNLGVVCFSMQQYERARQAFEYCLTMDPSHRGCRNNLEKVLKHLSANTSS